MGAEQSRNERKNIPTSAQRQGVSRDEINKLLEQQKREYERKLQEINVVRARDGNENSNQNVQMAWEAIADRDIDRVLAQHMQDFVQAAYNSPSRAPSTCTPASTPIPSGAGPSTSNIREAIADRDIDRVLAQHMQDFVQAAYNSPSRAPSTCTPASTPIPSGAGPSTSNISLDRDRNPYRLNKNNLPTSNQTSLYPSLDAAKNASFPVTDVPLQRKGFKSTNNGSGSKDYVVVNTRFRPSAPPLPTPPTGAIKKSYTPKGKNKDVDDSYNCKTCSNKYGLTIFQCLNGHSSCKDCKVRGMRCGICSAPIGDTRNIDLEKLISERKTACPNSADGCKAYIKMADIDAHLKECPFRDFICPLYAIFGQRERCRWKGKLAHVVSHFDDVHPAHRQANIDTEMALINVIDDNHIVHLVDLTPYMFLVHLRIASKERMLYMTVQLLGTLMSASKWSYELQLYNKREKRRKFSYTDICHSSVTPLDDIFRESKCVAISQSYASSFVNEGCLMYKFYIKKDCENVQPASRGGRGRGDGRGRGRGRGARAD